MTSRVLKFGLLQSLGPVPDLSHIQSQLGLLQSKLESLLQQQPSSSTATLATGTSTAFHVKTSHPIWILNSRGNGHSTDKLSIFSSHVVPIHQTINLADGSTSIIQHKGAVCLSPNVTFTCVLHVLNFAFNLLSVSHLAKTFNCVVISYPIVVSCKTGFRKKKLARDISMMGCIILGILLVRLY